MQSTSKKFFFSTLQNFYIQQTEFSVIQKNTLMLMLIIIPRIVKLKENKNKKILYKNFKNCLFIIKMEELHFIDYKRERNTKKTKRWRDRERERERERERGGGRVISSSVVLGF